MPPSPGDRFGRYELAEQLGSGAMGDVFSALDTLLHRRVALKIVRPPDWTSGGPSPEEASARVLREARAAARITHPNAVAIYDVGEVEGIPFLAMELVTGKPLSAFVGDAAVPLDRRLRWLAEVASALGAAHALGLVHRDVKPDNVMVGSDGTVKVLDFGIARRASAPADPSVPRSQTTAAVALGTLTAEGVVLGTPFYMAPEQMRGEAFDGHADQFSWGVIAYELLTGAPPWDRSGGDLQVVVQILSREVNPPSTKNAEIPAPVDAVIQRAMRKDAAQRFPQTEEIVLALEPFAELPGSSAEPPPRTQRALAPAPPETPPRPRPPENGRGNARGWTIALVGAAVVALAAVALRLPSRPPATSAPLDAQASVAESQMSPNAEATAAYLAGLKAQRGASLDLAEHEFNRAITLDPHFAAAHLRRALLVVVNITPEMRADLESARNSRALLGEHDRTLLDAIEPWMSEPPDLREARRRLDTARAAHPSDVDFAYQSAWMLYHANDFAPAVAAFDALGAGETSFPLAWYMRGRCQVYGSNDVAGAIESFERCLALAPGATSCLTDLSALQATQGNCQDMADTSRRMIAAAPGDATAYGQLAAALVGIGAPMDAVRQALEDEWSHSHDAKVTRLIDEESLALLRGDFDEAERQNRSLEGALETSPSDGVHWMILYDRMLMELEVGRDAEVLRLANQYLRRRAAWQVNDFGAEPTIFVYALELMAGGLTTAGFAKLRDEWIARDVKRVARVGGVDNEASRWAEAYTLTVTTPEEAAAAMAKRPGARVIDDALRLSPYLDEPAGRADSLAGRLDEAIEELTRVSGTCAVLELLTPVFSTWAALDLGQAFEARSDAQGACAAYRRVIDRWGAAKPPSRTAAKALARARSLGCEP